MEISGGFWVFAYGSLIWNPGFAPDEQVLARLGGYHRSFCMASVVYRGTPEDPGLVLALDAREGASCSGVAYRVGAAEAAGVLAYLRERELVSSAYFEALAPLDLEDGRRVEALAYVIDPAHEQYRGGLALADQAEIIARSQGAAGPNRDYLLNTAQSLARLGIEDPDLAWLAREVGQNS